MILYLEDSKDTTGLWAWLSGTVLAYMHEVLASISSIKTNPTRRLLQLTGKFSKVEEETKPTYRLQELSSIPITTVQSENNGINDILKKNKIPRNDSNQSSERPLQWPPQNTEERNWKRNQKMERLPVFPEWQIYYCKDHITFSPPAFYRVHAITIKIPMTFFPETEETIWTSI